MYKFKYLLLCVFVLLCCCSQAQPNANKETGVPNFFIQPDEEDEFITKICTQVMSIFHYDGRKINDEISHRLYDAYIRYWDSNHLFFLEEDFEEFGAYKNILDNSIVNGDCYFAFIVYARYMKRLHERIEFVKQLLKEPMDFTINETINTDRKNAPWAKNKEELDEIWRKDIKNQLIQTKLAKLLEKEKAEKEKAEKEAKEKTEQTEEVKEEKAEEIEEEDNLTPEERILKRYTRYYKLLSEYDHYDVLEAYLSAFTEAFDPHSGYMNWRTIEDFSIALRLSLQGIGATLTYDDGYTKVVSLVPGGPAEKQGSLKAGYRIIAVGNEGKELEDVLDMPLNKVVRKIRGPKGTKVVLRVIKDLHSVPFNITIEREEIPLKDSEAKGTVRTHKDSHRKYGIISLPSFYRDFEGLKKDKNAKSSVTDVHNLIDKMIKEDHIEGLIIDLRNNPGGSLEESIDLSGLFIPNGPMVQVKQSVGKQVRKDNDQNFAYNLPMVIMINTASASAAEIFAGAMQDYKRAVIVGQDTYGKGTVQNLLELNNLLRIPVPYKMGAMKCTIAKFYRITGASTQLKGVEPDIAFPSLVDESEYKESGQKFPMKWDEIDSLKYETSSLDVSKYLPALKEKHKNRLNNNKQFQNFIESFQWWKERQNNKVLSLNLDERLKKERTEESKVKEIEKIREDYFSSNTYDEDDKDQKNNDKKDIYLDESLNILHDLVEAMQNKE